MRGVVPTRWFTATALLGVPAKQARQAVLAAEEAIVAHAWNHIWLPRCKAQQLWEKAQGIKKRDKRAQAPQRKATRRKKCQKRSLGMVQRWLQGNVCKCGWALVEHIDRGCSPSGLRAILAIEMYIEFVCRRGERDGAVLRGSVG